MKPTLVLLALVLAGVGQIHAAETKPNIIFILADDLGVGNVGCYGADNYKTPHIDALANGGIRYTRAFTAPLCGPSRTLIMTGQYAFRTGTTNQDRVGQLKPSVETMLPKLLKPAGYVSSAVGKWSQFPLQPSDWGFDDYLRFNGSGVYWNKKAKGEPYVVNGESKSLRDKEYMPDLLQQHVTDFITKHRDDPFFVYYSLSSVHGELQPTPDSASDSKDLMGDNVAYMDKLVGKLVAELERLKLREKTLIVFMGDNGTGKGQADRATIGGRRLSGEKGSMLEGGALVPLIVNWPGVTPSGRVAPELVESSDFLQTFAELAGAKLPEDTWLDGRSFAPQLCGQKRSPRDWIFVQLARNWYVREPSWKLNQAGELFDMTNAPFAEKLVAADTKDTADIAARQRLQEVLDKLNPAGGILDDGDGTGRHANKDKKKAKSK